MFGRTDILTIACRAIGPSTGRLLCLYLSEVRNCLRRHDHEMNTAGKNLQIRNATETDVPLILSLIQDLATYERAPNDVSATEEQLRKVLFGKKRSAEVLFGFEKETPVGFAVFFHNFSTWL